MSINHPIRCTVEHGAERTYTLDLLPIRECGGIEGVLLYDGPDGMAQGVLAAIRYLDFQFMSWEKIEANDFDWERYLGLSGLNLPAVTLGDSDELQVGEWAIVIGNPIGEKYSRSVTIGAISGLNREVTDQTIDRYGRLTTVTNTMIQTDAAINSGNSGGGMFNILGQLQGIPARYANSASNSMYSSGRNVDNIGLCIPINVAKPLIREVMLSYSGESTQVSASASTDSGENSRTNKGLYGRPGLGFLSPHFLPAFPFTVCPKAR